MTDKKVWFITGAGRGMGVDIATAALAAGNALVASGRNPERVSAALGAHDDLLVVKLDVTGLKPATWYYYRFGFKGTHSRTGRTRTAPAAEARPTHLRFGVVSCTNWQAGFFAAYRGLARRNDLHAVLHLGDYLYEYGPGQYGYGNGDRDIRTHDPRREMVSLEDYRRRHAHSARPPAAQPEPELPRPGVRGAQAGHHRGRRLFALRRGPPGRAPARAVAGGVADADSRGDDAARAGGHRHPRLAVPVRRRAARALESAGGARRPRR